MYSNYSKLLGIYELSKSEYNKMKGIAKKKTRQTQ